MSDTGSRERGRDITAAGPGGATQAHHWFAGAVLDLILYRHESATAHVALGLPDGFTSEDGTVREEQ